MTDYVEQTRKVLRTAGRSPKTANSYLSHIRRLENTYGNVTESLDEDTLRKYLEDLVDEGKSLSYINQAQSAIRFMYKHVLSKDNPLPGPGLISKKIPLHGIFSRDEIKQIFANVHELKYRLALMLIYSSGLRVGEATHLLRNAVDFDSMVIHVNDQDKEFIRDTILANSIADILKYYIETRTDDSPWMFPGRGKTNCISPRTIQRAFAEAMLAVGIEKRATLGWLRHSFAVHMLEDGIDRKLVRSLLGITTPSMISPYMKLAEKRSALRVNSPADRFLLKK
ncbi:MAG: site-specific integrase [Candidatus Aegiribacteria sp.]|nr:site-specific integrase [Candidatus Aegiribacteria sp.]